MKTCELCHKEFPLNIVINNKLRNLQRRKLCLECSPFGEHNTNPLYKIQKTQQLGQTDIKCAYESCDKFTNKHNKFCSKQCSMKFYVNRRRREIKQKAIDYKGGKCQVCGYNKCVAALHFHHLDTNEKDFHISKSGHSRSWERVKAELDKCQLLCANCHAEIHAKEE